MAEFTPPRTPTNLQVIVLSESSILVTWDFYDTSSVEYYEDNIAICAGYEETYDFDGISVKTVVNPATNYNKTNGVVISGLDTILCTVGMKTRDNSLDLWSELSNLVEVDLHNVQGFNTNPSPVPDSIIVLPIISSDVASIIDSLNRFIVLLNEKYSKISSRSETTLFGINRVLADKMSDIKNTISLILGMVDQMR